MTNTLKYVGLAVAGIVVGWIISATVHGTPILGGVYNQVTNFFPKGIVTGDREVFYKSGTIGLRTNQAAWTNDTGRRVTIDPAEVHFGWNSGIASSTYLFYVSTSTNTTVTNYARPAGSPLLIDGARRATSTPAITTISGTTTTSGAGAITVGPNESLIFNIQPEAPATCTGLCETATSSSRGIAEFFWNFKGTYAP